ncbi:MAG TPA: RNA polymerase sigma factor [Candidatus Paceibacterota bacterium]
MESFERLVSLARNGDKEAFGELYSSYFTPIYRFLYWRTKHKEIAEDLTQTVFLKAYEAVGAFENTGAPFLSWLYTIAHNLYLDYIKKRKFLLPDEPDTFWENQKGFLPGVEKEITRRENREALDKAISELSDNQQELVILRFVAERSYGEIAEITGKTEDALRALNYRAMKLLKEKLKNLFEDT